MTACASPPRNLAEMPASRALPLLDEREAAQALHISPRLLRQMRSQGTGPAHVRLSPRIVGYMLADLDAWLRARRHAGGIRA